MDEEKFRAFGRPSVLPLVNQSFGAETSSNAAAAVGAALRASRSWGPFAISLAPQTVHHSQTRLRGYSTELRPERSRSSLPGTVPGKKVVEGLKIRNNLKEDTIYDQLILGLSTRRDV